MIDWQAVRPLGHQAELTSEPKLSRAGRSTYHKQPQRPKNRSRTRRRVKTKMSPNSASSFAICRYLMLLSTACLAPALAQQVANFPGVTRDLASFCSARPSLSIDLASMVVHVKKLTSFNYKLYLFSSDNHVFQTGQIVPRDDFRIHSFPVKLKHFNEFLPANVATYQQTGPTASDLTPVSSSKFEAAEFFARVPLEPGRVLPSSDRNRHKRTPTTRQKKQQQQATLFDVHGDVLPGEEAPSAPYGHHDVALAPNSNVHFDRDDQVAVLGGRRPLDVLSRRSGRALSPTAVEASGGAGDGLGAGLQTIMPVGAFSSFHVNTTYLARKDFGQRQPKLVRLQVDPFKFQVTEVHLLGGGAENGSANGSRFEDDYAFLGHKLLADPSTRLTSINQIYEDWITRNFYTIVYIQRRLEGPERRSSEGERDETEAPVPETIVTDRLIFRGSSMVLLGADQLDYEVKASAFITEKNGLHYYFEFLTGGKFYLGAIDWTKRPFAIIDAQRFPLRQTKTKFDNEELLLCPPSVCYSDRPIDELVAYGRLALPSKLTREVDQLTRALSSAHLSGWETVSAQANSTQNEMPMAPTSNPDGHQLQSHGRAVLAAKAPVNATTARQDLINLDKLTETVRTAAGQLEVRLHLRDWAWTLPRAPRRPDARDSPSPAASASKFSWRYELARRNEVKVAPDTYGFVLTGHEIDASFRVYNELYLISANHLISINYTLVNETVTSVHPIGDEFQGLSSTFLDPITGAYYDRYANQLFIFKGDRYVGFDYATKRPLDDFLLPPGLGTLTASGADAADLAVAAAVVQPPNQPLVSSLPVVGILGRQHHVDAIYHDLHDDLVYVFVGTKFYTFQASDFKDGAFRAARQPVLRCINEHFFEGCRFDGVFPNPCNEHVESSADADETPKGVQPATGSLEPTGPKRDKSELESQNELKFREEQQMKLRSIAARGGAGAGLLELLLENTLSTRGSPARMTMEPLSPTGDTRLGSSEPTPQERIVLYLLAAMVIITILVTAAMIFVILSWARVHESRAGDNANNAYEAGEPETKDPSRQLATDQLVLGAQMPRERLAYPPAISQYLSNQYHQHELRHQQPPVGFARRQPAPAYLGQQLIPDSPPQQRLVSYPAPRSNQPPLPAPPRSQHLLAPSNQQTNNISSAANRMFPARPGHDRIVDSSAL